MRALRLVAIVVTLATFAPSPGAAQDEGSSPEVIRDDVKKFLDPTELIRFDDELETSFLPGDSKAFTHLFRPFWPLNHWSAFWAEVPVSHFAIPEQDGPSGIGDVLFGWGAILHENLDNRLTTFASRLEVRAPTGNVSDGTGTGRWVIAPGGAVVLNPSDYLPIFVLGRDFHAFLRLSKGSNAFMLPAYTRSVRFTRGLARSSGTSSGISMPKRLVS